MNVTHFSVRNRSVANDKEKKMYRKLFVALVALIGFVGLVSITTSQAEARRGGHGHGFHRGGHVGHMHRGFGPRHFGHRHYGHRHWGHGPRFGFRPYYRPYSYGYYGANRCYRWRPVATPYGVQMRRVWVCGPRYINYPRYY